MRVEGAGGRVEGVVLRVEEGGRARRGGGIARREGEGSGVRSMSRRVRAISEEVHSMSRVSFAASKVVLRGADGALPASIRPKRHIHRRYMTSTSRARPAEPSQQNRPRGEGGGAYWTTRGLSGLQEGLLDYEGSCGTMHDARSPFAGVLCLPFTGVLRHPFTNAPSPSTRPARRGMLTRPARGTMSTCESNEKVSQSVERDQRLGLTLNAVN